MALALLSKLIKEEKNKNVYFVHVDHAIRKNSSKEALQLKNILKKYQINLKCFNFQHHKQFILIVDLINFNSINYLNL